MMSRHRPDSRVDRSRPRFNRSRSSWFLGSWNRRSFVGNGRDGIDFVHSIENIHFIEFPDRIQGSNGDFADIVDLRDSVVDLGNGWYGTLDSPDGVDFFDVADLADTFDRNRTIAFAGYHQELPFRQCLTLSVEKVTIVPPSDAFVVAEHQIFHFRLRAHFFAILPAMVAG